MREMLVILMLGIVAGLIDILPMIKMKLDKYSIGSAFTFYLILPIVIFKSMLFENIWWMRGGIIGLLLVIPVILIVLKEDKKAVGPMCVMSFALGSLIGIAGHFIL